MGFFGNKSPFKKTGDDLVADFQAAITNLITMETALYAATQSEQAALSTINLLATNQSPSQVIDKDYLIKTSLDAHVKKVQADNITAVTNEEITRAEAEAKQYFIGKKVSISAASPTFRPFESLWYDVNTRQHKTSRMSARSIKGIIEDLSFDKNIIVVKPRYLSRLVVSSRQAYIVQVIDTSSMQPLIKISLK